MYILLYYILYLIIILYSSLLLFFCSLPSQSSPLPFSSSSQSQAIPHLPNPSSPLLLFFSPPLLLSIHPLLFSSSSSLPSFPSHPNLASILLPFLSSSLPIHHSHLPFLSSSFPILIPIYLLIHSILVGTYIYLFIFNPDLFPHYLISFYTCRHLHTLIYIPDSSKNNSDPACFIGVDG